MTDQLLIDTATNVLNRMMGSTFFSICEVRQAARLLDVTLVGSAYTQLEKIHCVHWCDMPESLRDAVPALIAQALATPAFRFEHQKPIARPQVIEAPKRPFLFRLMGGNS